MSPSPHSERPRARALLITPIVPARGGNGLAMRAGLFLEGLARDHDVDVVLVPAAGSARADSLVEDLGASMLTVELDGNNWATHLLGTDEGRRRAAELYPLPANVPRPDSPGRAAIARLAARADIVQALRTYLMPCLDAVLDGPQRPPIALDVDELESELIADPDDAARTVRLERHYLVRCDRLTAASAVEASQIERLTGLSVDVVPNAVRPPVPSPADRQPAYDLLFVGNLSYAPNVDAVRWLCDRVVPLIGGARVRVALVGSGPGPEVLALGTRTGVVIAADVPDVTPFYRQSRVAVVPIRSGGGTRTKIAEAQVHGVPVISTSLGAAGLEAGDGAGILIADDAAGFAARCRELIDDPVRAQAVGDAGRRSATDARDVVALIAELSRRTQPSP